MERVVCFITPAPGESPTELARALRDGAGPFANLPVLPTLAPAWLGRTVPLVNATGPDQVLIQNLAREMDRLVAEIEMRAGGFAAALDAIEAASTFTGGLADVAGETLKSTVPAITRMAESAFGLQEGRITPAQARGIHVSIQTEITATLQPLLSRDFRADAPLLAFRVERTLVWVVRTPVTQRLSPKSLLPVLREAEIYFKTQLAPFARSLAGGVVLATSTLDISAMWLKAFSAKSWDDYFNALGDGAFGALGSAAGVGIVLGMAASLPIAIPTLVTLMAGGFAAIEGQAVGRTFWKGYRAVARRQAGRWVLP